MNLNSSSRISLDNEGDSELNRALFTCTVNVIIFVPFKNGFNVDYVALCKKDHMCRSQKGDLDGKFYEHLGFEVDFQTFGIYLNLVI